MNESENDESKISETLIVLKSFLKDSNISLLHRILLNINYKFDDRLKLNFSLINTEISVEPGLKFWNELKEDLLKSPPHCENIILFFEAIIRNLRNIIPKDSVLLEYLESTDYCFINVNPKVNKSQDATKIIPAKDKAIMLNIVEYSNFILNIFRHVACHSREKKLKLICEQILNLLEPLLLIDDIGSCDQGQSLTKPEITSQLCSILKEISDVFYDILLDAANFSLLQIRPSIVDFVQGYERNAFLEINLLFESNRDTITFEWIRSQTLHPLERERTVGQGNDTVPNYNEAMVGCYLAILCHQITPKMPETIEFMDDVAFREKRCRFRVLVNFISLLNHLIGDKAIPLPGDDDKMSPLSYATILENAMDKATSQVLQSHLNGEVQENRQPEVTRECLNELLIEESKLQGHNLFGDPLIEVLNAANYRNFPNNDEEVVADVGRILRNIFLNKKFPNHVVHPDDELRDEGVLLQTQNFTAMECLKVKNNLSLAISHLIQSFGQSYSDLIDHNKSTFHPLYLSLYKMVTKDVLA